MSGRVKVSGLIIERIGDALHISADHTMLLVTYNADDDPIAIRTDQPFDDVAARAVIRHLQATMTGDQPEEPWEAEP